VIDELLPLLERGDILIDGGNSLFTDTIRRTKQLEAAGMLYVGSGVSGGEEGALTGPSLMPGGSAAAWPHIKPIFRLFVRARRTASRAATGWARTAPDTS
jgi:6-phosphogluconate dehydrogenase